MLARIPDLKKATAAVLLVAVASVFVSCASQKQDVRLVNDPDEKPESQMPWNKQEKWETSGGAPAALSGITDRR